MSPKQAISVFLPCRCRMPRTSCRASFRPASSRQTRWLEGVLRRAGTCSGHPVDKIPHRLPRHKNAGWGLANADRDLQAPAGAPASYSSQEGAGACPRMAEDRDVVLADVLRAVPEDHSMDHHRVSRDSKSPVHSQPGSERIAGQIRETPEQVIPCCGVEKRDLSPMHETSHVMGSIHTVRLRALATPHSPDACLLPFPISGDPQLSHRTRAHLRFGSSFGTRDSFPHVSASIACLWTWCDLQITISIQSGLCG